MINPEVIAYIRQNLQAGVSPEKLRENLLANGWSPVDVDDVFREVTSLIPSQPRREPETKPAPVVIPYASFFRRVAGHLIDGIIVSAVVNLFSLVVIIIFEKKVTALMMPYIEDLNTLAQKNPSTIEWADIQTLLWGVGVVILVSAVVSTLINILYRSFMESSSRQATLGKIFTGLQVVTLAGERLSFARALGRNVSSILSSLFLCIGYLMALFTEKKQTLHDKIAGTLVLDTKHYGGGRVFGVFALAVIFSIVVQNVTTRLSPEAFKEVFQGIEVNMNNSETEPPISNDVEVPLDENLFEQDMNPTGSSTPPETFDGSGL